MPPLLSALMMAWMMIAVPGDTTGVVRGTVVDSLSGLPLGGALVQLVDTSATPQFTTSAVSDEDGRYRFSGVPGGTYRLGFFHPLLDSLSVQSRVHLVRIDPGRTVEVPLSTPSAAVLRAALCGASPDGTGGGVAVGMVRRAPSREPIADATVYGEWVEFAIGKGGLTRTPARRIVRTTRDGWFALCNVPAAGNLLLSVRSGTDSTERFELTMPPEGVLRQTLLLGDPSSGVRLRGRVRRLGDGRVLPGAIVTIPGVASTRANDQGEWFLPPVPAGTRTIEYRAVGYYPGREVVQIDDQVGPQDITMATMQSVLDTVKVIARYDRFRTMTEFSERRRAFPGRFLTAEDIRQRVPLLTSDLFRAYPGLFVDTGLYGQPVLTMRGVFEARCTPAIYINGFEMLGFDAVDLDAMVKPDDILGVEIYSEASVPIQFKGGMRGCGSLIFWTR
jgi:hypothetical protein